MYRLLHDPRSRLRDQGRRHHQRLQFLPLHADDRYHLSLCHHQRKRNSGASRKKNGSACRTAQDADPVRHVPARIPDLCGGTGSHPVSRDRSGHRDPGCDIRRCEPDHDGNHRRSRRYVRTYEPADSGECRCP